MHATKMFLINTAILFDNDQSGFPHCFHYQSELNASIFYLHNFITSCIVSSVSTTPHLTVQSSTLWHSPFFCDTRFGVWSRSISLRRLRAENSLHLPLFFLLLRCRRFLPTSCPDKPQPMFPIQEMFHPWILSNILAWTYIRARHCSRQIFKISSEAPTSTYTPVHLCKAHFCISACTNPYVNEQFAYNFK